MKKWKFLYNGNNTIWLNDNYTIQKNPIMPDNWTDNAMESIGHAFYISQKFPGSEMVVLRIRNNPNYFQFNTKGIEEYGKSLWYKFRLYPKAKECKKMIKIFYKDDLEKLLKSAKQEKYKEHLHYMLNTVI